MQDRRRFGVVHLRLAPASRIPRLALFPLPPALESLYAALFSASSAYFALPPDAPEKTKYAAPSGVGASDEGFSDLLGEKALIIIRRAGPAGIHPRPCATRRLRHGKRRALSAGYARHHGGKRVVAEAHMDLGILTLVVGASPGLSARDAAGRWLSVEDAPFTFPQRLTLTLLVGQSLTYLIGGLFAAGTHRHAQPDRRGAHARDFGPALECKCREGGEGGAEAAVGDRRKQRGGARGGAGAGDAGAGEGGEKEGEGKEGKDEDEVALGAEARLRRRDRFGEGQSSGVELIE
ncbi:hypothetical protein C8R45DRAFT_1077072 [Mycena sanguinolenta]|nr:hypothetical protein C8R45DRAFT_1077072 [Mycena sanguinolenta]